MYIDITHPFCLSLNSESKVVLIVNNEEIPDYFKSTQIIILSLTQFFRARTFQKKKTKRSIDKFFKNTTTPANKTILL